MRLPSKVEYILDKLHSSNHPSYVVGGCVRDSLLGRQPKDWDICTAALPEETEQCFDGYRILETGLKHGTITVLIDKEPFEITTFREDGDYLDNRHPENVYFVRDVTSDLARRDFTMNAIAYNPVDGFVDPFNGMQDIQDGIIRCVGNPYNRFNEDALRILRALRFSAVYGFEIADETQEAIHSLKHLLHNISAERIKVELEKLICGANALPVLLNYSDVVAEVIPELKPCIGNDHENKYHCYNIYDHIAHAVHNYEGTDPIIKWALLLHDIGKPECKTYIKHHGESDGYAHYYKHQVVSARMAAEVLDRLRFDTDSKRKILQLVEFHDYTFTPTEAAVKHVLNKFGEEQAERLFQVRWADIAAHTPDSLTAMQEKVYASYELMHELLKEKPCFTLKDLAVKGNDLISLGMEPGKLMGECLHDCLEAVMNGEVSNDRGVLMEWAGKWMDEHSLVSDLDI